MGRRIRRRQRKRTWGQLLVVLAGLVVFAAAVGGAAGLAMVKSQTSKIPRVSVGLSLSFEEQSDSEAQNLLLVGSTAPRGSIPTARFTTTGTSMPC